MTLKLTNLFLHQPKGTTSLLELRADFSNDRHFAVVVQHPGDPDAVRDALLAMASLIGREARVFCNSRDVKTTAQC